VYFLEPPHVPLGEATRAGVGLGVGLEDARVDVWIVVLGLAVELDGTEEERAAEEMMLDEPTVETAGGDAELGRGALADEAAEVEAELDCAALAEEAADDATTEDEPDDKSHLPKPLWHPVPQWPAVLPQ
jgi:hypothetical protein